jgi:hypothetical protein
VKWGADFYIAFQKEFSAGVGETAANIVTLGGYGGVKRAYNEGRITATDFGSAGRAYAEGVFNTLTLGAGERAVGAYAEGKGGGGIALEGLKGAGETVLPINEVKTLFDPTKSGWEKAEAIATGTAKIAGLAAGGLAAKNAITARLAGRAGIVAESATGAEASMVPAEGSVPQAAGVPAQGALPQASGARYAPGDLMPNGAVAGEGPGAMLARPRIAGGPITDAEIDAAFSDLRTGQKVEMPGQNPSTGQGLAGPPELRFDPDKPIAFHDNWNLKGIKGAPAQEIQVRTHSPNRRAPAGKYSRENPTTQITDPNNDFYMDKNGVWRSKTDLRTDADWDSVHLRGPR